MPLGLPSPGKRARLPIDIACAVAYPISITILRFQPAVGIRLWTMTHFGKGEAEQRLRAQGLRPTKARCLLLNLLGESQNHSSTEEMLEALRRRGHRASAATLHQNLNRLIQEGLLAHFTGPDGLSRFDANLAPHHHLVCVRCGRIVDVEVDRSLLKQLAPVGLHDGPALPEWQIKGAQVEFRGICTACQSRP